jgi:hypothetical protein
LTGLETRLRAALAPTFTVEEPLAHGGMGVVFRGRHVALDHPVAIKVIRPGKASAVIVERFLREARLLASLQHPNIVAVHHAGEADGIPYYVMELLEGETLAERLRRGPLSPAEVTAVGRDLLAALGAAHARGIVHRDVKPGNIFLQSGRAILTDFGISKQLTDPEPLTLPHAPIGTARYMAPEQAQGREVTPASDVYAAGLVLYEAFTGRDYDPDRPDFGGVPRWLRSVLRKALARSPAARWPDAGALRKAYLKTLEPTRAYVYGSLGTLVLVAGLSLTVGNPWSRGVEPSPSVTVAVMPFQQRGGDAGALGDSLVRALRDGLRGTYDFTVLGDTAAATIRLRGTMRSSPDSLWITVQPEAADDAGRNVLADWRGRRADWPLAADSLSRALLVRILSAYTTLDLPGGVLPRTPEALTAWARAERHYARSEWNAAKDAYLATLTIGDCLLCEVRLLDIGRWQRVEADSAMSQHFLSQRRRFPPRYQTLIVASQEPLARRLALLDSAVRHDRDFWFAFVAYGDEIMHRGPLVGRMRAEAMPLFERATVLRPEFAPAWEHLARVAIAEGREDVAQAALRRYEATASPTDETSQMLRLVNSLAMAWRFGSVEEGRALLGQVLRMPGVAAFADLSAGPRYFLSMDAPDAALWLARWFADSSNRRDLVVPGLAGQAVAQLALGHRDSALMAARLLQARDGGVESALFAAQLATFAAILDSLDHPARWPALAAPLERLAAADGATPLQRRRAAFTLALGARAFGDRERATALPVVSDWDENGRAPFRTLLGAEEAARRGNPRRALQETAPLLGLDSAGRAGDPFFRTVLHLLRAAWFLEARDSAAAVRELLWYQNSDITGVTRGVAQPVDVDAAFGTLARWRLGLLLEQRSPRAPETCAALGGVARLWARADPPLAQRALEADRRRRAMGCVL